MTKGIVRAVQTYDVLSNVAERISNALQRIMRDPQIVGTEVVEVNVLRDLLTKIEDRCYAVGVYCGCEESRDEQLAKLAYSSSNLSEATTWAVGSMSGAREMRGKK